MTLMDYCMQYIDEIMDGKRPAPEGITLTETDPVARGMELLQKVGDFPTLARLCAAQDGTQIPREVYDSFDPGAAISMFLGRDGEQEPPQAALALQPQSGIDPQFPVRDMHGVAIELERERHLAFGIDQRFAQPRHRRQRNPPLELPSRGNHAPGIEGLGQFRGHKLLNFKDRRHRCQTTPAGASA